MTLNNALDDTSQDLMTRDKLFFRFAVIGLILLALAIYYPSFSWAFVGDDYVQFEYIKDVIANPWTGFSLFNPYYLPWYYRPLQLVWFSVLESIFHFLPDGYYWVALLFHALAISLVYRVARQLRLSPFTAVLAAALFAIHGHWVDVVSWISSIAIVLAAVFSLLTVSSWLSYLKRPSIRQLLLTLLFCVLTFFSHEESILLPPFLLLILIYERLEIGEQKKKRPIRSTLHSLLSKKELRFFILLILLALVYIGIQFTRPNLTIDITERQSTEWLTYFSWTEVVEFVLVTIFRFTLIVRSVELAGWAASLFVGGILVLTAVWFWQGNRTVKLGLSWLLLHLMFIYWALWTQLPELYAGRHIYQGMIGLVLAIGASVEGLLSQSSQSIQRRKRSSASTLKIAQIFIVVVAIAVTLHHINQTTIAQENWLLEVAEEAVAREKLAELFPTISPESHFFAYRFPIAPQFTRSVVQLWYDTPLEPPGGSLDHLRQEEVATRDFVVLDYHDGQMTNLMPELQQHDETIFLWARPSHQEWIAEDGTETAVPNPDNTLPVVKAPNGTHLSLQMTPENGRWLSHTVVMTVPTDSELHTAVLNQSNLRYRLRLITAGGEEVILFDEVGNGTNRWQPIIAPLMAYGETAVMLRFEVWGDGVPVYWANPRLVR